MGSYGREPDASPEDYVAAVRSALDESAPRPVVDSKEVAVQLEADVDKQTVRRNLKEIRHFTEVSGYSSPKWLWWIDEN